MYFDLKKILENSKNIVFFGGAGVSTESGVPDFRSSDGLYSAMDKFGRSPEELLSYSFFKDNTNTFYDYYKNNLIYKDVKPNNAHLALAELENRGNLNSIVTQNIDGLHQMAGSRCIHELHGSIMRNYCMDCGQKYSLEYILTPMNCMDKEGLQTHTPYCNNCGGIVRPDVVLYEEALNQNIMAAAINDIKKADTLIVGGTSLIVYPAAGLISYFKGKNLVLINKSKTSYDSYATLIINDSIGKVLGECVL